MTDFNLTQLTKHPQYVLLGLATCLFSICFVSTWRAGALTHLGVSGLFLLVVITLVWENHPGYEYRHERWASLAAVLLIGWLLWQSLSVTLHQQLPLRVLPFASALAIALLASGFRGLWQYRRELAIMFMLALPSLLLSLLDISVLTAQMAARLLHWGGVQVVQDGVALTLPMGMTIVHPGCSGLESIAYLIGIAVVCLTLYPVKRVRQVIALLAAGWIGFGVNSLRVATMATLAAPRDDEALLSWTEGDGAIMCGALAIGLFALVYWLLYRIELAAGHRRASEQLQSDDSQA
ncbi:MAG: cyanoexosortase A [Pegethrix bostrychoides GSE-TBD4-15B]|jgi:cyanoexosortase A|uniref:Cyanoexosortase A n=1 Tax=Pegethrix bostrychoides GSE-TBD4-15B TaxID=2839662 RepID=A0A951U3A1_9CYAN|nr:cyanoexosortase A [Pegethrix bostrychoides GSE-TBD4-15B]